VGRGADCDRQVGADGQERDPERERLPAGVIDGLQQVGDGFGRWHRRRNGPLPEQARPDRSGNARSDNSSSQTLLGHEIQTVRVYTKHRYGPAAPLNDHDVAGRREFALSTANRRIHASSGNGLNRIPPRVMRDRAAATASRPEAHQYCLCTVVVRCGPNHSRISGVICFPAPDVGYLTLTMRRRSAARFVVLRGESSFGRQRLCRCSVP
jgi:hypothetical protein